MKYTIGSKTIHTRTIEDLFGQDTVVIRIDDIPKRVRKRFEEHMRNRAFIYYDHDWWAFFKQFKAWYEKEEDE